MLIVISDPRIKR